jgi:protein-S-isoprenylcysteine O-methyltransferase Ste14
MEIMPLFRIGWLNGWIPLAIYFTGLVISISLFPKESRLWLFNNPKNESNRVMLLIRLAGQFAAIAYIVMLIFTPLKIGYPIFTVGATIFAAGFTFEMSALHTFRNTPFNQPAITGLYRVSRNPQWVGLFLVLLGSAIAVGCWLYIAMVIIVGFVYHIQILDEEALCQQKYGDSYLSYMRQVRRYFLFF